MISYSGLTKLKTNRIVYESVFIAHEHDPGTLEYLKELSMKRRAVEEFINESSNITQAVAREMSGGLTSRFQQGIHKLEQYLPLLENLVFQIDTKFKNHLAVVKWVSDLKIRWSSALASSSVFNLNGPKMYQSNDVNLELAMSLSLYGAMLRERAFELSSSDHVEAATLFRKAAGVYDHLSREVYVGRASARPPEAQCVVPAVMCLVCLAEAQAVAARKAEENGKTSGLIAKLHNGIAELLAEAKERLEDAMKESKDVSPRLMDYISSCKALHVCKSHHYTAERLKGEGEFGAAIGILRLALSDLKKAAPKEDSWRPVFRQAVDDLSVVLRKYEHENDFVWHEKVPCGYDCEVPSQSVHIVSLISYRRQRWGRKLVFKLELN